MELNQSLPLIENADGSLSVDARGLHKSLGVGRDFSNWIKDRIEKYGFSEGKDYSPNLAKTLGPNGGRPSTEYLLSLPMAKEIAMVENNEAGKRIRHQLIKIEEAWNQEEVVIARAMQLAGRKLFETKKLLLEKDAQIAELEPKAREWDRFLNAEGLISFQDAASRFCVKGMGQNNLFDFAKEHGFLIDSKTPFREHIDAGRVAVRSYTFQNSDGKDIEGSRVYLTARGMEYLAKKLEAHGYVINSTWNKVPMVQMVTQRDKKNEIG